MLLSYSCPEEGRVKLTQHDVVPKEPTFPLKRNQDISTGQETIKELNQPALDEGRRGLSDPALVSKEAPSFLSYLHSAEGW